MQNETHPLAPLNEQLDTLAHSICLESIPCKSAEMHRLLDEAIKNLLALLAYTTKIGVELADEYHLKFLLLRLLRDEDGKRFVDGVRNGKQIPIDVDDLDLLNATRYAYAKQLGVTEQDVIRFESITAGCNGYIPTAKVPCNHPGCNMQKGIPFRDPAEMLQAENCAKQEIWYCHHHRKPAFTSEGILSDETLPLLQLISRSPGLTQTATGARKDDLSFLEETGLIRIEKLTNGNRVMCYQIFITALGQDTLNKSQSGNAMTRRGL